MSNKIFIWNRNIDSFINEDPSFGGGITVQMYLWSKLFLQKGWQVFSISTLKNHEIEKINFLKVKPSNSRLDILSDFYNTIRLLLKTKPKVIFFRGASRNLAFVVLVSKFIKSKVVLLSAHDTDFELNNEIIKGKFNRKLYQYGVKKTNFLIVQNDIQNKFLIKNYSKKKILKIPNIWPSDVRAINTEIKDKDFLLWVGNFHKRKRPHLFLELAKQMPNYEFIMVGGPADLSVYNRCKNEAESIPNLEFLGPKSFWYVNALFKQAKIFVCTSESEGFPNTFLQSWSNLKPVVSTFDPSNVIATNKLGVFTDNLNSIIDGVNCLLEEKTYKFYQSNIETYFKDNHDQNIAYNKILNQI